MVNNRHTITQFICLRQVVSGQQDGRAFLAKFSNQVSKAQTALRIQPGCGFIEEEDLWPMTDGPGDLEALGYASGELVRHAASGVCEVETVKERLGDGSSLPPAGTEVARVKVKVLQGGQRTVQCNVLGHYHNVSLHAGRVRCNIHPSHTYPSGGSGNTGRTVTNGRRLASTIRA
jgi:hypothetical protein